MSGWLRVESHWWADVAAALPRPWPRGAVLTDLRFWAGEVVRYRATSGRGGRPKRPGRAVLAKRWGWSQKKVRLVIAGGGWEDPYQTEAAQGPAEGQKGASRGPAEGQKAAPNQPEPLDRGASRGPVEGQKGASRGPPARDVPYTQPSTLHPGKGSGAPPAAPPPDLVEVVNPPAPPPGRRQRAPSKPSSAYQRAIHLWDQEYLLVYPGALAGYPWRFSGRDADGARVKSWLAGVRRIRPDQWEAALQGAIRSYLRAVRAGTAWPVGEPPSTRIFTRDLSRWLQAAQGVQGGAGGRNGHGGGGTLERARRARERTTGPTAGRGGTVIDAAFRSAGGRDGRSDRVDL